MKKQRLTFRIWVNLFAWLFGLPFTFYACAENQSNLTSKETSHQPLLLSNVLLLSDVLSYSLAHSNSSTKIDHTLDFQSATWLAASPRARLNYLKSQREFGTDEIELSVNLAIKSNLQRSIDKQLIELGQQIKAEQVKVKQLYFSGLLRESIWLFKIAKTNETYIQNKLSTLKQLEDNSQQLVVAGEISDFGLLLIQKELIRTQVEALNNQKEIQLWQAQYQQVTGFFQMPERITEPKFNKNNWQIAQHPEIQLLEKRWQQNQLIARANSSDAAPWNIAFTTVNTDTLGEQDRQIGVSIEVPLTFVEATSQTLINQNSQEKQQFTIEYQNTLVNIGQKLNNQSETGRFLNRKLDLLKSSIELNQKIMQQLDRLRSQNEMGQEFILRRVMDTIKAKNEYAITKLLIQQNNAMLRQVAGIPL